MAKFLLHANLSDRTAAHLATALGLVGVSLERLALRRLPDPQVVALAEAQGRVIVTQDRDFARLYFRGEDPAPGIILLRLEDQSRASVNRVLERFFRTQAPSIDLEHALVTVTEHMVSIVNR